MIHRCLLAAVCTAMCGLLGTTVAEEAPCPGGGLEFLQSKWALWFRLNDINNDGKLSSADIIVVCDRIERQRDYTPQQTQALKDDLSSLSAWRYNLTEEQLVSAMTDVYHYINDDITFRGAMTAEFTAMLNAFLQLNGAHITEDDLDLLVEAMNHPEYEAVIALYVRNHEESGLTLDELVAFLVDDVSNPCPTETGVLEEAMQQNGPVV